MALNDFENTRVMVGRFVAKVKHLMAMLDTAPSADTTLGEWVKLPDDLVQMVECLRLTFHRLNLVLMDQWHEMMQQEIFAQTHADACYHAASNHRQVVVDNGYMMDDL
jgi:hypothetical protein